MESRMMEEIVANSSNRYEALRVISMEARRINTIMQMSDEVFQEKPTTIAMRRFAEGKVKYRYAEKKKKEEQEK